MLQNLHRTLTSFFIDLKHAGECIAHLTFQLVFYVDGKLCSVQSKVKSYSFHRCTQISRLRYFLFVQAAFYNIAAAAADKKTICKNNIITYIH